MQHLYVLRRFSSWSFRLGVSVALLLSGAGLGASLLASTAMGGTTIPPLTWKPTLGFTQVVSTLPTGEEASAQVLPVSLSSMVPTYSFAASPAYSTPLAGPASSRPTAQAAASELDFLPATNAVKATVQRSWDTFKLAFR